MGHTGRHLVVSQQHVLLEGSMEKEALPAEDTSEELPIFGMGLLMLLRAVWIGKLWPHTSQAFLLLLSPTTFFMASGKFSSSTTGVLVPSPSWVSAAIRLEVPSSLTSSSMPSET